jgi:hypothetical protein
MIWLPDELKKNHCENNKRINSKPTVEEMRSYVNQAAKDCKFEIEELDVKDDHEGVMEINQPEDNFHKITVRYNPNKLCCFTTEEIISLLRHEILHPITMQESSKIVVSQGQSQEIQEFQSAVQLAYDEMINYRAHVERFPNDKALSSAKKKMYTNFSIIFLTNKYNLEQGWIKSPYPLFVMALSIYEDSAYNFFENRELLDNWAKTNNAQALIKFLDWVHEDLSLIQQNVTNRDEMREIIFLTVAMITSVMIDQIFLTNNVMFTPYFNTLYERCEKKYIGSLGKKLLERWKERFDNSPYSFP